MLNFRLEFKLGKPIDMISRLFAVLLASLILINQGCTYRAWYEGFQEGQRSECYKISSQSGTQECLDRINSVTYEEYKRARNSSGD